MTQVPGSKYTVSHDQRLYDDLIRLGLTKADFEYNKKTDSLMRVHETGVKKLVKMRFRIKKMHLHISMLPDSDSGVVTTALVSAADDKKGPGFWYVVLDVTGRPVAEYPLTYSMQKFEPESLINPDSAQQPPPSDRAVETTGDLARLFVSWLVSQDRVNDDESAKVLEIVSIHVLSPRTVILPIANKNIAQRFHDELLCFEDDIHDQPTALVQASTLRENLALLLNSDTL